MSSWVFMYFNRGVITKIGGGLKKSLRVKKGNSKNKV